MSETRAPLAADDPSRRVQYIDLVLGAWRPREAATQLALALGIELPPASGPAATGLAGLVAATDRDAAGEPTIVRAWADAAWLAPSLSASGIVAVLAPRYGLPLLAENEWFLLFLRRLGVPVAAVGDEPALKIARIMFERRQVEEPSLAAPPWLPPPHRRLLRFFPGLLPQTLAERVELRPVDAGLVPHGDRHWLIPVSYRDADPARSPRDLDAMAGLEKEDAGLQSLTQSFCTAYFAEVPVLTGLAEQASAAGSHDLSDWLAARARTVAREAADAARADLCRQQIRLADRRFGEMASAAPPSPKAPPELRRRLERLRIAGELLAGNSLNAEKLLEPAIARLKAEETVPAEDLRLLVALAEARIATSDVGGAYFLAEAVGAALARDPAADRRLVFENGLVLARIHRLRGASSDERAAIRQAYATSAGARSLHEIVEFNVALAVGEPNPQSVAARAAWLRAALAWLSIEPPEALSRRAVVAILGRDIADRNQLDLDISDMLADRLDTAWPGLPVAERQKFPVVRAAGRLRPERLFAGPGAGVLWTSASDGSAVYARPRQRLIRLALVALGRIVPGFDAIVSGTVLVDANLGLDVPATRAEALALALRTGISEFAFEAEKLELDETMRARLAGQLRASLSPIVAGVDSLDGARIVRFGRHLPDRRLTAEEAADLADLLDGATLTVSALAVLRGRTQAETEAALRPFEAASIVRLEAEDRPVSPPAP